MTTSPVPKPDRPPSPMKSPTKRSVAAAVGGLAVVLVGLLTLLWLVVDDSAPQAPTQLELVRIALTILLGTGGLFGLYLAYRRQRSTEIALQQKQQDQADVARAYDLQRDIAEATQRDAEARRITDLYTKAVEQLGSDKAPVRLGGLYALERLAQEHRSNRQTIVNVCCAYLRMPYALPGDPPPEDGEDRLVTAHRERVQEREVRLAAQRILADHLRAGDNPDGFWSDIDLDLTGATLIDLDLSSCSIGSARFAGATFVGDTAFRRSTFVRDAMFDEATFADKASFRGASFDGRTGFRRTTFTGDADFVEAAFSRNAGFVGAVFTGGARFVEVTFTRNAAFSGTVFGGDAEFRWTAFTGEAWFRQTTFGGDAGFVGATFARHAWFDRASVAGTASFRRAVFSGTAGFAGTIFSGNAGFRRVTFAGHTRFGEVGLPRTCFVDDQTPPPWTDFADARFERDVPREVARFVASAGQSGRQGADQ